MKRRIVVFVILISLLALAFIGYQSLKAIHLIAANEQYVRATIDSSGGAGRVLLACRAVLENQAFKGIYGSSLSTQNANLPELIRNMKPLSIAVDADVVTVGLGRGVGFLAFREDVPQYGTRQITNGLWYWNYRPSSETRIVYMKKYSSQPKNDRDE